MTNLTLALSGFQGLLCIARLTIFELLLKKNEKTLSVFIMKKKQTWKFHPNRLLLVTITI